MIFFKKRKVIAFFFQRLTKISLVLILGTGVGNCGIERWKPEIFGKDSKSSSEDDTGQKVRLISVNVKQSDDPSEALALLSQAADTFSIQLDGCVSGNRAYANPIKNMIEVIDYDKNCKAKLLSFTYSNMVFQPTTTTPFTTWDPGDTALFFELSNPTNKTKVTVVSQLRSPVQPLDSVSYSFSEINNGGQFNPKVGSPRTVGVTGQSAPAFKVTSSRVPDITAEGAGVFEFNFECANPMTGSGLAQTCVDIPLSEIRFRLVKDDYNSIVDITTATTLFKSGTVSITPAEVLPVGSVFAPNGGFKTPVYTDPRALQGPNKIVSNPNMILILEGLMTSYTYFNVDVETPSQTMP